MTRGNPWSVISLSTDKKVCNYPAYCYDNDLLKRVCFASNDDEVKNLIKAHSFSGQDTTLSTL